VWEGDIELGVNGGVVGADSLVWFNYFIATRKDLRRDGGKTTFNYKKNIYDYVNVFFVDVFNFHYLSIKQADSCTDAEL
jgi:hypothetical protein